MADLTITKTSVNNVFTTKLEFVFRKAELDLITAFGEPKVEIGGDFSGDSLDSPPVTIAFTLTRTLRKIKSQFPLTMSFDGEDDDYAEDKANIWTTEMIDRLDTLITELNAKSDGFTSTNTVVLPA